MTKEELVHLTLKQLTESLKLSPENFRLEDSQSLSGSGPTILWQHKVQLDDNKYVSDPMNCVRTIIVSYNTVAKQLSCYIYNREVNNINLSFNADAQATINYGLMPPFIHRTYRQFSKLKKSLIDSKNEKEYLDYMRRLNNIFPATHEDDLFK